MPRRPVRGSASRNTPRKMNASADNRQSLIHHPRHCRANRRAGPKLSHPTPPFRSGLWSRGASATRHDDGNSCAWIWRAGRNIYISLTVATDTHCKGRVLAELWAQRAGGFCDHRSVTTASVMCGVFTGTLAHYPSQDTCQKNSEDTSEDTSSDVVEQITT